jgi:trans-aconitate methyltransferase
MSVLVFLILLIFILILASLGFYMSLQAFYWLVTGVPFVNSRKKIINFLIEEIKIEPEKTLYDLGCGDGKVIFNLAKNNPLANFIGYELNPSLIWIAKIFRKLPNIQYQRQNFFKVDIKNADYVFLFLFPELMDKLLPKLEKELKPGAIVISNSFKFSQKKPFQSIESPIALESLYFYQF